MHRVGTLNSQCRSCWISHVICHILCGTNKGFKACDKSCLGFGFLNCLQSVSADLKPSDISVTHHQASPLQAKGMFDGVFDPWDNSITWGFTLDVLRCFPFTCQHLFLCFKVCLKPHHVSFLLKLRPLVMTLCFSQQIAFSDAIRHHI